ncbi:MAG TPA: hypothetical protein VL049_30215 [Candidatus Dormibacteraeota bacterium]|nr:hypothetical protein [Candidatus Dormibacteraeota bacterium]
MAAGCSFSSAPPDDVDFAAVTDLHQLDGRYRNRGQGAPGDAPLLLSALVFPTDTALAHAAIEVLEVRATSPDTLTVRAIGAQGVVVTEGTFVAGRDFTLDEGRVRIGHRWAPLSYSPEHAPDDPLVGPRTETVELGIDRRGQGKYRSSFTGAGLVYLIVPIAFHQAREVRFERIEPQPPPAR